MARVLIFILGVGSLFLNAPLVRADHGGPDRVVETRYVVSMLPLLEEKPARIKFFFRDVQSGKSLTEPVRFTMKVFKDGSAPPVFTTESLETRGGVGEFSYAFPSAGIFILRMEFELSSEPGIIHRPDEWSLWVPGAGVNPDRYPIGPSEISGLALLLASIAAVLINVWYRRRRV